ncbi:MAG TPA: hypothetical protein VJ810_40305 [Blastocatellia bacterium]|nr:hypothetical protein [Blastocatellia bacterium]
MGAIEEAKKLETRERRIRKAVEMIAAINTPKAPPEKKPSAKKAAKKPAKKTAKKPARKGAVREPKK